MHVILWHSGMYLHVCIWSESWRGSEELIQSRLWVCVKAVHPCQWQRSDWLPALLTARPSIRATNHCRRPSGQQLTGLWWPVSHDSLRSFTCSLSPHWEMMFLSPHPESGSCHAWCLNYPCWRIFLSALTRNHRSDSLWKWVFIQHFWIHSDWFIQDIRILKLIFIQCYFSTIEILL